MVSTQLLSFEVIGYLYIMSHRHIPPYDMTKNEAEMPQKKRRLVAKFCTFDDSILARPNMVHIRNSNLGTKSRKSVGQVRKNTDYFRRKRARFAGSFLRFQKSI